MTIGIAPAALAVRALFFGKQMAERKPAEDKSGLAHFGPQESAFRIR
jgi:hypothetical protein